MKETFYFSHDYNARSDEKIKKLLVKHGILGYGVYWAIIEGLYQNANAMRTDYECIAYELRVNEDCIKSIINDFDLFEIEGNVFGSLSVQRRLDERDKKSKKARESALYRWNKNNNDANAMRTQCDSNAIKESKGKENKGKENKEEEIFDFKKSFENLGVEKSNLDAWLKVRKLKRGVNSEPAFDLIKKEIEKSGFSANECIKMAAAKSWSGFKAEWMDENKKKEYALDTIREWYNLGDLNEKLSFKKFGEFLAKTKHLKYLRFDIAKDDVMKKIVEVNQEFGSSDNIYYEMAKYDNENERSMKNVFYKSYKKAI